MTYEKFNYKNTLVLECNFKPETEKISALMIEKNFKIENSCKFVLGDD